MKLLLLILFLSTLSGCIPAATAVPDAPVAGSRLYLSPKKIESLKDGSTTRVQALLELGEPDRTWAGHRYFCYASRYIPGGVRGGWAFRGGGFSSWNEPAPDKHRAQVILLEFDAGGTLLRHHAMDAHPATDEHLLELCNLWASGADMPSR